MTAQHVQRAFNGGEIAPSLYARTDLQKYHTSLRTCRNMIVQRHGGVTMRPGTDHIQDVKNSAATCRLAKFVLDSTDITDTYVLELGLEYIRFYQNAAPVVVSGVTAWADATAYTIGDLRSYSGVNYYCIAAHTSVLATNRPSTGTAWRTAWYALTGTTYEIPSTYQTSELPDINMVQKGDIITLVHPNHPPRELRRYSSTRWILSTIVFGPSIAAPTSLARVSGGVAGFTYWAVTAVKQGTREESLPALVNALFSPTAGSPVVLSWNPVADAISYNVYRSTDGVSYGLINPSGGTPVVNSETTWTDANEAATTTAPATTGYAVGQARNPLTIGATTKAYDGKYTVKGRATLAVVFGSVYSVIPVLASHGRALVYYSRGGEPRVLAANVTLISYFGEGTSGPTAFSTTIDVPDNGYTALTIDVVPEVDSGEGPAVGSSWTMTLDFTAAPDNAVEWSYNSSGYTDAATTANMLVRPPTQQTLFGPGAYPAEVMRFQQRQLFGNIPEQPDTVWGSRIASDKSFTISSPLQDDDVISFGLDGRKAAVVRHMLDLSRLVLFTTGPIFVLDGNEAGTLTPSSINPRRIAQHGIGRLSPLEVGDSAVYVQARQTIVRDLSPVEAGPQGGYQGTDLSVFAPHLFDGYTIADWDYAELPHSVVWAVRSDGTLLGLTYLRDQGTWGWHRHDTDGTFENVCTVPEGAEDAVYVVVKRTINGAVKRYIERFASPRVVESSVETCIRMDCSGVYNGWTIVGVKTITLSGGSAWDQTEQLTATVSAGTFTASDVNNGIFLRVGSSLVRCTIEAYTSATVVTLRADRSVPTSMRSVAIGNGSGEWAHALKVVPGFSALIGKSVSVLGDGFVVASPNNPAYTAVVVSAGASITLDRAYAIIYAGLPYIADVETLDLDLVGAATNKHAQGSEKQVVLFVEKSRGIWIGKADQPTTADPTFGLNELRGREQENYDQPPRLLTESVKVQMESSYDFHGRFLVRQVDPIPLTVLSASPAGYART